MYSEVFSHSKYHGGKMEGPAIRRLMEKGPEIFYDIAGFLKSSLGKYKNRDAIETATDEEVDKICLSFGKVYLLLDSVFSFIYNIRNRPATQEETEELNDRLEILGKKWIEVGLSFTPKMHLLLDHLSSQIRNINGYGSMGEDRIERNHQERMRDGTRFSRSRKKSLIMGMQAKAQHIRVKKGINNIRKTVEVQSSWKKNYIKGSRLKIIILHLKQRNEKKHKEIT